MLSYTAANLEELCFINVIILIVTDFRQGDKKNSCSVPFSGPQHSPLQFDRRVEKPPGDPGTSKDSPYPSPREASFLPLSARPLLGKRMNCGWGIGQYVLSHHLSSLVLSTTILSQLGEKCYLVWGRRPNGVAGAQSVC